MKPGIISISRQCELMGVNRSMLYYRPSPVSQFNLHIMKLIDALYTRIPSYGAPRMTLCLQRQGYPVNHKRIERLMQLMGIQAIHPKRKLSIPNKEHTIYPYLLRGLVITRPNSVWCTDITYIPMRKGFIYLVAIMDWYSRYILSWRLSLTLDAAFCVEALREALTHGTPEIFNSDQGSQFTSNEFTALLADNDIRISMDGRGRAFDNIFIERLWRTVKYEEVYIKDYVDVREATRSLDAYLRFYNEERIHTSIGGRSPFEAHFGRPKALHRTPGTGEGTHLNYAS
jgi:putative transposase